MLCAHSCRAMTMPVDKAIQVWFVGSATERPAFSGHGGMLAYWWCRCIYKKRDWAAVLSLACGGVPVDALRKTLEGLCVCV